MIFNMNGVNIDNVRTDEEIKTLAETVGGKVVTGEYTGDGATSRVVDVGFTPKFAWVWRAQNSTVFMMFIKKAPSSDNAVLSSTHAYCRTSYGVTTNGFAVGTEDYVESNYPDRNSNISGKLYAYVAIG